MKTGLAGRGVRSTHGRLCAGFSRADLVAVVAVVGLGGAAMLPVMGQVAIQSPLQVCMSKQKEIHKLFSLYAGDNQDRIASFNWRINERTPSEYPDLRGPWRIDADVASAQAIDIMRRIGGRTDIGYITGWAPWLRFNNLVIEDYAGLNAPSGLFTCPKDWIRIAWQKNPRHFNDQGVPSPVPPGRELANHEKRFPYGGSFRFPTATWSGDRADENRHCWTPFSFNSEVSRGREGNSGERRMAEVAFPSSKVMMIDEASRHFTTDALVYTYADAKQPYLFFDGVVRTQANLYGNPGANPARPGDPAAGPSFTYTPQSWQPRLRAGDGDSHVFNQFWSGSTRMGLAGRDFFGAEVFP